MGRVESQLIGADILDVRAIVDGAYERIVQTMFESLKQMAKMQGEGEDKGQLNYHVELVGEFCFIFGVITWLTRPPTENMQYFISEVSQLEVGTVKTFLQRAQTIYDENLNAYVKLVLRRPLAKILVSDGTRVQQETHRLDPGLLRWRRTCPTINRAVRDLE